MRLTIERKRRGWSQAKLARNSDLNTTTVNLIESGRFRPYPKQLAKLARALDIPENEASTLIGEPVESARSSRDD
jgi:transcriptional regulator with XRE-family HTH domain